MTKGDKFFLALCVAVLAAVGIWSTVDPGGFRTWEGLVLLAMSPLGLIAIFRYVKPSKDTNE